MNANETALLDPFDASTPDEATELTALTRALELAEGFSLIFVRCNQIPQREKLMEEVRARLPKLNIQPLFFREPIQHLLDAVQGQLTTPLPDALFVSGLEFSLPVAAEASSAPLIANLNASRNSFAQTLPCPVVLWVPEYVLAAIMQGAPDFFSIRSGVYFFAAKPAEIAYFAQELSIGEMDEIANLSDTEKQERISTIKRLLADYELLPDEQRDQLIELSLYEQLGLLFQAQGEYDTAFSHYQSSLKVGLEISDSIGVASSLLNIGNIYLARGEYKAAQIQYEQSLRILEELGIRLGVARLQHQIGTLHFLQREYEVAQWHYEQALQIFEELRNRPGIARSFHQIGMVLQRCQAYDEAQLYYEKSLRIRESLSDRAGVARLQHQIGTIHQLRGEYEEALTHYEQSLKVKEELGDRVGMTTTQGQMGQLFTELGRYSEAFEHSLLALESVVKLHSPNVQLAIHDLKVLRAKWNEFDTAWRNATGADVPEWLS